MTYGQVTLTLSVAVADVNGDGKPDLLVTDGAGLVDVLLGNGDGTFQVERQYASGGNISESLAVADINGDGKLDLLVADVAGTVGGVGVLLGNGDGTFQSAVTYGSSVFSVAVADINGDGEPDLLVANWCGPYCAGSVGVLLGNGDGSFQAAVNYGSGGSQPVSVAVADVNGDGKPDLLVANLCVSKSNCANGTVGVLINTGTKPTKTALVSSPNPSNFGQLVTFTATVTSTGKGAPTGTVSFFDGTTNLGTSPLNSSGVATFMISTLTVGTHSITAMYNGDANFEPSTSPVLKQVVQQADVMLSPTKLDFGNQTVGIASNPQVSTLTNTGNLTLTITSISVTGADSHDFAEKDDCGTSVPPQGKCRITVTFAPAAVGKRTADVKITDNAPDSPQVLPLSGVGVLPAVTFSPTHLTFPDQVVFTSSRAHPVTLTNKGLGILLISKIATNSPFSERNNCPKSIAPGAKCTISVKFDPGNKGVFHSAVSVTDNAPGSPQEVALKGTGTFVQLAPPKLNFGTQPVGTRSGRRRITLTNKGDSAVNITGISITGADASDFFETNNCGNSVPSGASCLIQVTFKPLAKGKKTASVEVKDDGGGSPQKVSLSGTGT